MRDYYKRNKKKLNTELRLYFPRRHSDSRGANVLSELKRQTLSILDKVLADHEGREEDSINYEKTVRSIDDYLISRNPPGNFLDSSSENEIIRMDIAFQKVCTSMEEVGVKDPAKLTVFEFESKVDYYEDKAKKLKK